MPTTREVDVDDSVRRKELLLLLLRLSEEASEFVVGR